MNDDRNTPPHPGSAAPTGGDHAARSEVPAAASGGPAAADLPANSSSEWWPALRPLVLRLHFYAGILIAPFLVIAALTGLLYVFTPQLENVVYDHELHVPAAGAVSSLDEQVAAARRAHPGEVMAVRPAPSPTETTQVIFEAPDLPESYRRTAFVDPHTTEVRGVLETYGSGQALPLRAWVDNLHRNLHLGEAGRVYSELAASWLWVVVLGGVALWLGRRRSGGRRLLLPQLRGRGRRRVLPWHATAGLWAAVGLLFLSATGLTWSLFAGENVGKLREALAWEDPSVSTELAAAAASHATTIGFDRVHEVAEERGLSGPMEITPSAPGQAYTAQEIRREWPTQRDSIAVDPGSGAVTDTVRFADYPLAAKLARWGIDGHMGLLFGWPNQVALALLTLALLAMIFSGYRMWWLRRPTRPRFGAPPARGAWRRVPAGVLVVLVAVGAAVAYALPLLGGSLAVFLAVDVAAGRWRRRRSRTAGG